MASNWLHRLFNPHCPHCLDEMRNDKVCPSCEILRQQLEVMTHHNNKLLDRILNPPAKEEIVQKLAEITPPRNIPWNVRRQMLEAEDREKAKLMKAAPQPATSVEDLEKELDIASEKREATS